MLPVFDFDAACALSKGERPYQEDAIIADFARGSDIGLAVLADGMGGHAAGDVWAGAGLVAQPEMIARMKSTKHPIWARFIWRVIAYPNRQVVIKLKRVV